MSPAAWRMRRNPERTSSSSSTTITRTMGAVSPERAPVCQPGPGGRRRPIGWRSAAGRRWVRAGSPVSAGGGAHRGWSPTKGVPMENQDRELILGLANRLRQAQPVQKDPQAAELIAHHVGAQPDALYLLVQAVLVQEDALRTAQARIAELQAAAPAPAFGAAPASASAPPPAQAGGGGFMSRVFGQNRDQAAPAAAPQGRSGGGFLKTAAAAAAGVAGGALLFQGLNGAFGGHEASAGEHHGDAGHEGWGDQGGWDDGEQW
ncbi:hypothetical protein DMA12_12975 [Amycolatopsis balhimycina DSM 5908]|uniref:DUF2076 domain-containing protein n=2 Tax=Amycolatopsis balhimycina TaxID=208443 RepID=A0A428WRX0_AMYBA|nr:hypothetical protein DMA12_12975 [Amycolatopsis balhimycina DSM 5908]